MEKYAVIMAGGTGTRLWPLSRENRPKQFISIENGSCMLAQTIERIRAVVPRENCFIITNKSLMDITRKTVKGILPFSNIIPEPVRKDTAACIAYTTLWLKERVGTGLLCFLPADGYVKKQEAYQSAVKLAYQAAERTDGLVVIGITPTYPATGYGYIHIDKADQTENSDENMLKVRRFIEKPDADTAKKLVASKEFLWNSGILLGSIETITNNVRKFLPDHFEKISRVFRHADEQALPLQMEKAYGEITAISFDKGVLEKSGLIYVVKGNFDWDDIGNLDTLAKTFPSDAADNRIKGMYLGIDTARSVIYSEGIPVTAIGVENMIIAVTKDAVLICPRDRVQDIKALVALLKSSGYGYLL